MDHEPGKIIAPSARRAWLALVAVALGVTMDAMDATVVAVANPSIAVDLDTDLSQLQWVSNGYLLATAAFLITAGKLGDRFGHRRVFLAGVAGFVASSVLVGLSGDVTMLAAFRVVQGLCGAALMPTGYAILRFTFPEDKLKVAIGVFTGVFALAMASGPFLGGLIVELGDWRWVFFVNILLGGAALVGGLVVIPATSGERNVVPFDLTGVLLLTVTLTALVWAIIQVPQHGWTGAQPLSLLAAAVVFGTAFVLRERSTRDPVLPLRLFRSPSIAASVVINLVASGLMFAMFFFIALYLRQVHGFSPLQAGLGLMPVQLLFAAGSPIGGWLNGRLGPRVTIVTGLVLFAVALFGLSTLRVDSSYHALWPFLAPLGLGMSLVAPTVAQVIVSSAQPQLAGVASGLGQTAAFVGAVLGIAGLGSLISARVAATLGDRLAGAGLPAPLTEHVRDSAGAVAQGVAPVPPGTPGPLADAVVRHSQAAFVDGLRLATLAGGVAAVAAIGLALLVRPQVAAGAEGSEDTADRPA